jgi:hypothetical protein
MAYLKGTGVTYSTFIRAMEISCVDGSVDAWRDEPASY